MILTCPSCSKRFVLPARLLAPEGRTVKCSSCAEEWFQLPDPDELLEDLQHQIEDEGGGKPDNDDDFAQESDEEDSETGEETVEEEDDFKRFIEEDIPDAVKPIKENSKVPALQDKNKKFSNAVAFGFAAATLVFVLILAALVFLKEQVVKAYLPAAALYEMAGMEIIVPGEGLVFDRVQISTTAEFVTIEGMVINLKSQAQQLPMIEAQLIDAQGDRIGKWFIEPPSGMLDPEATLPFKAQYEGDTRGIESVKLRFVLSTDSSAEEPAAEEPAAEEAHEEIHEEPAHAEQGHDDPAHH